MGNVEYYEVCKECEFLYHCYGREIAERIQQDKTDDMHLRPSICSDFFAYRIAILLESED